MTGRAICLALALVALCPASAAAAGDFAYGPDQLEVVSSERLSERVVEMHFRTPAVNGDTGVRVLLPEGYDTDGGRRYPVLYLLHGCCNENIGYTLDTEDNLRITAGRPLIVVKPDSGPGGGYVDWYNNGAGGPPMWETYHLGQLLPWIDQHFRTIAERGARATAGASMGGNGAMNYAARHPDLFVAAASFSGAVDTNSVFLRVSGAFNPTYDQAGTAPSGPRETEEVRWRGRNPWDLAENLDGLHLTLRTGNGQSGGPGNAGGDCCGDPVEMEVHEENVSFHKRLAEFAIPHIWDDYGPGCHCTYYWNRSLEQLMPDLAQVFAAPPSSPSPFDYRSIEPAYEVHDWEVAIDRPALEFSELRDASRNGFTLRGSGAGTVTTPPLYRPGRVLDVEVVHDGRSETERVPAGSDCRLRLSVPLGPGNPYQQYTAQANVLGTAVFATRVRIGAERTGGCPGSKR